MRKTNYPYSCHRFPHEVISHAVCLYHRFTLSFRDIEEFVRKFPINQPDNRNDRCDDLGRLGRRNAYYHSMAW